MDTHILKEIDHVAKFLHTGVQQPALAQKLATSIRTQISNLPVMTAQLASTLKERVLESPYPEDSRNAILEAIEQKLVSCMTITPSTYRSSKKASGSNSFQKRYSQIVKFLTTDDVEFLRAPNVLFERKQQRLADRIAALQVHSADEHTHAYCLALLLALHFTTLPSNRRIHTMLKDWKAVLAATVKPSPFHTIIDYPQTPHQLPTDVFSFCYPEGSAFPEGFDVGGLKGIVKTHIALRGNSKLLKKETKNK